jgi:type IV pilus assembly protein PilQ
MGYRSWASLLPIAYYLLPVLLFTFHFSLLTDVVHAQGEDRLFSLEFRDEEIRDVLKVLAQESGRNIIIPETITGKVTLSLDKITLSDALDVILKSHGLGYIKEKGVIRIVKLSEAELGEELLTEVVTMNYARASDLVSQVKGVLSARGTVSVDPRTNSFIVRDAKKGVEDAKRLIERLDPKTPQVLIEARIIEASSNFSRSLGIQWGGRYASGSNTITGGAALGTAPSGNSYAVNVPATGPTGGLGMSIGSLDKNLVLDVQLSAAEKRGEVRIVSTPKVTTVNNKSATVSSGIDYSVKTTTIAGGTVTGGTQTTQGTTSVSATTSLTVTPQVSADGHILLTITASRDEPDFSRLVDGIPGIVRKNATTTVLVKDGETTVIGGLYRNTKGVTDTSVPFLSRIPVIGWLFKSRDRVEENEELLIFITPRIIGTQS